VHPYFDTPDDHFDWIPDGHKILISYKTAKGQNSIEMFGLDNEIHNEARAKEVLYMLHREDADIQEKIERALVYRRRH
jgi:uncharacterized protein (UPF0128 family)